MLDLSATQACSDVTGYRGYYFIGAEGEEFVTEIEIFLGYVFVGGFIPTEPKDPCDAFGSSSLYAFRIHCGEGFFTDATSKPQRSVQLGPGLPTNPRVTVGNDGDPSNQAYHPAVITVDPQHRQKLQHALAQTHTRDDDGKRQHRPQETEHTIVVITERPDHDDTAHQAKRESPGTSRHAPQNRRPQPPRRIRHPTASPIRSSK